MTTCGRIRFNRCKIELSVVFAGQSVGIKQVSGEIWLVSSMDYDLRYSDQATYRLNRSKIPSDKKCYVCLRNKPYPCVRNGPGLGG